MARKATSALRELLALRASFGAEPAKRKAILLKGLARARLDTAERVLALHELLCFVRAYPDSIELLQTSEQMLASFANRSDLIRHRDALVDSGIAGTSIHYRFFWPMARWLARRWPDRLVFDWDEHATGDRLKSALPLLVRYAEAAAIKRSDDEVQDILQRLCGDRTDATFVIERIDALAGDDFTREALHDSIDSAYRVEPGPDTPSRTRAKWSTGPIVLQRAPLRRDRPDLATELKKKPFEVRDVAPREGRVLIDLACEAMVTRSRDLEAFVYGDPRDVRLVIDRDGLAFAVIGFVPERRLLMRAGYGLLTLKNGVPIGYVQADALFASAEIAFNTFDTFRGGESALVFARLLAVVKHLFDAPSFSIEPYQLGHENEEGLESGAWWFYYKLGFRPADRGVKKLVARELARMQRDPAHRSTRTTLAKLAARHLYFELDPKRQPVEADLARLGWSIAGIDGDAEKLAARRLGLRTWNARSPGEKIAIARWSPILLGLSGVERWSVSDRMRAAEIVRAKGGRRESDFVRLFDAHPKLARAIADEVFAR